MNLLSAFFGALTLPLVAASIVRLTGRRVAGLLGAGALAVSHTFWLHAVRAEVYTLHTFFFAAVIVLALRWTERPERILPAVSAAFVAGLGVHNHLLMLTILPAFCFLLLLPAPAVRMRLLLTVPPAFLAGAAPYVFLTLPLAFGDPARVLLSNLFHLGRLPRDLLLAAGYFVYQFPLGLIAAAAGAASLWRHRRAAASFLLLALAAPALFALCFHVRDQYVFYISAYVVVAVLAGAGAAAIQDFLAALRPAGRTALLALALIAAPVGLYALAPGMAGRSGTEILGLRRIPGRDIWFFLWPPKSGYVGALRYAEGAFSVMPENALIVADWTLYQPLRYMQCVESRRRDVRVQPLDPGWKGLVPYLIRQSEHLTLFIAAADGYYDVETIRRHFEVVPAGPIYRLERRP